MELFGGSDMTKLEMVGGDACFSMLYGCEVCVTAPSAVWFEVYGGPWRKPDKMVFADGHVITGFNDGVLRHEQDSTAIAEMEKKRFSRDEFIRRCGIDKKNRLYASLWSAMPESFAHV